MLVKNDLNEIRSIFPHFVLHSAVIVKGMIATW